MNARPSDALDACPDCGQWVRCGQPYHPAPVRHATCPTYTAHAVTERVRIHTPDRSVPGRKS